MRLLIKLLIIASIIALGVLAYPISTQAKEVMVFPVMEVPDEPQPLYRPYLTELKPKPKKSVKVASKQTGSNKFAPGYCTAYVASKVKVTWRGNANRWIPNAKAQGYVVDKLPTPGSIIVTSESGFGHVGYIESVSGNLVTFSEWNYAGRFIKTIRTLDINNPLVKGIIHI